MAVLPNQDSFILHFGGKSSANSLNCACATPRPLKHNPEPGMGECEGVGGGISIQTVLSVNPGFQSSSPEPYRLNVFV